MSRITVVASLDKYKHFETYKTNGDGLFDFSKMYIITTELNVINASYPGRPLSVIL